MSAIAGLVQPLVDAPPVTTLRYGIFNAARVTDVSGSEDVARLWGAGYSFLTDHCGGANAYDDTCVSQPTKPFVEGSDLMNAAPFRVIAKKHCGTVGRTYQEMDAAVRQQLISGEQTVLESVIWNGDGLGTHTPTLVSSSATATIPTADGAGAAIAALEALAYGAAYGYQGVIHINQRAYAALAYSNILHNDAGVWRTNLGTAVSFGAGYGITGPLEVPPADGFVWAFMTSQVDIRRTPIVTFPSDGILDRVNNQWEAIAERAYAFTWDCPETFAVQVPVAAPAVATAPTAV